MLEVITAKREAACKILDLAAYVVTKMNSKDTTLNEYTVYSDIFTRLLDLAEEVNKNN